MFTPAGAEERGQALGHSSAPPPSFARLLANLDVRLEWELADDVTLASVYPHDAPFTQCYICIRMYVCVCVCVCVYIYMCVSVCVSVCVCVCIYIHIYTYINICI